MKKIICLLLFVLAFVSIYGQNKYVNRLPQNRSNLKYTEISDGVYKIENKDGKVIYKKFCDFSETKFKSPIDSTVFYIDQIDTSIFYNRYKLWKEVPVSGHVDDFLRIGDANKNNNAELYGYVKTYTSTYDTIPVKIYEYDPADSSFKYKFSYPDSCKTPIGIYDIDNDGNKEFFGMESISHLGFYKPTWQYSLPTNYFFTFDGKYQMNHIQMGDYDRDGITEMLYYSWSDERKVVITKYNNRIKNFDSLYTFYETGLIGDGFSTGDIDGDGYPLIVSANIEGEVHAQKYTEENGVRAFRNVWNGTVETPNAYLHTSTNDIDGNGKKEFWVGGDGFHNGVPITRLTCFEADEKEKYKAVAKVDIVGIMSIYAFNMFSQDVDNCGKDEVCLCLDNIFMILKFAGTPNHHSYAMCYMKRNDSPMDSIHESNYFGAIMADVDRDSVPEILISLDQTTWLHFPDIDEKNRRFSYIYKQNNTAAINEKANVLKAFNLSNNYPNPFNPSTTISYQLPKSEWVTIKIYDILGNEVRTLVNEHKSPGSYTVNFDAGRLSSGVYIYRIVAGEYTLAKKMMLIK